VELEQLHQSWQILRYLQTIYQTS